MVTPPVRTTDPVQVTVDAADLETLLQTTGALKAIEAALDTRKRDPFVAPHLDFTAAHNRLAQAWTHALRSARSGETKVGWDEPLSTFDRLVLAAVSEQDGGVASATTDPRRGTMSHRDWFAAIQRLSAKGMVQLGQGVNGYLWAGDAAPSLRAAPEQYVRVTARGTAALKQENQV